MTPPSTLLNFAPPSSPVRLILDTDIGTDCDDAGALAMLHTLEQRGEANVLGVAVNNQADASVGAVAAINAIYGRSNIPIGAYPGREVGVTDVPLYTKLARDTALYGHAVTRRNQVPTAVTLYRRILAEQPDGQTVIVSIGFLNNLHDLLASEADEICPLDGRQLVEQKVAHAVIMGGDFPDGYEYNFTGENAGRFTSPVLKQWPTPLLFAGYSLGECILSGPALAKLPEPHPVRRAYQQHHEDPLIHGRPSWDQTTILAAVRGPSPYWKLSNPGYCRADSQGANRWEDNPDGSHAYLIEQMPPTQVAEEIESLMVAAEVKKTLAK